MNPRVWLIAPIVALYAADIGLTLAGQPAPYWAGDYSEVAEANPIAHFLMTLSPVVFIILAIFWLIAITLVVFKWKHPLANWFAFIVAGAHAIGGASWLTRLNGLGLLFACAYIFATAQLSMWCWQRWARNALTLRKAV